MFYCILLVNFLIKSLIKIHKIPTVPGYLHYKNNIKYRPKS